VSIIQKEIERDTAILLDKWKAYNNVNTKRLIIKTTLSNQKQDFKLKSLNVIGATQWYRHNF